VLVWIFIYQPWSPYNSRSKSHNNSDNDNLIWNNWFQIQVFFSVRGGGDQPPQKNSKNVHTREFQRHLQKLQLLTPRPTPDLLSGLSLPLKARRAKFCLAECKEQAENYRQGEVPGWYHTNPCWDNNLLWRLAESPKFNFGREGSVDNIVELVKTCLTIACQKVNVRSKENWEDVLSYFFFPKSAMETSWLHKTCAALLGRQPPVFCQKSCSTPPPSLLNSLVLFFLFEAMMPKSHSALRISYHTLMVLLSTFHLSPQTGTKSGNEAQDSPRHEEKKTTLQKPPGKVK